MLGYFRDPLELHRPRQGRSGIAVVSPHGARFRLRHGRAASNLDVAGSAAPFPTAGPRDQADNRSAIAFGKESA
ncbi:MAG: hypothetical protein R6X35_04320 [Candidatus Krumholzibacteriia bacterium]